MVRAYSVFDDFPQDLITILESNGIMIECLPKGKERPKGVELQSLLEQYDVLFISTGEKITEDMFERINSSKIIGTASRGIDHIHVPTTKRDLISIVNASSNSISVAEHVISLVFALSKCLIDGRFVAAKGQNKRVMTYKPQEITGKTMGIIGAGITAKEVIKLSLGLHMKCLCWTKHPENHIDLQQLGVHFCSLDSLLTESDVITTHIPLVNDTRGLIDSRMIWSIRDDAIFINTSRAEIVDNYALFDRAKRVPSFCVGLDYDPDSVFGLWDEHMANVIVTPHIAGGTIQSRVRLFHDCVNGVLSILSSQSA